MYFGQNIDPHHLLPASDYFFLFYSMLFKLFLKSYFSYITTKKYMYISKGTVSLICIAVTITFKSWGINMDSHVCISATKDMQPLIV